MGKSGDNKKKNRRAAPYEKKGGDGSDDEVEDMDAEPFLQKQGE
jgi:hypothetical protein